MLRVAHLADVHLDAPFVQFGAEGQRKRQVAIEEAFKQALGEAAGRGVDLLLIAGDLYEQERFRPSTADFLREQLGNFGLPVYIAPGNHDYYTAKSLYATVLDWPSNVHVFTNEQLEPVELEDGLTLWGAAHHVPATTKNLLEGFHVDRGGINLGVFHGAEESELVYVRQLGGDDTQKAPYAPFRAEQILSAGLDHAFVGHIHTPLDADHHTYPGNPEPLTFGEHGELQRGLVIASVSERGEIERERIAVARSVVLDLTVDLTGCGNNSAVRDKVSEQLQGLVGFVRVTLTGEVGEAVELNLDDLREVALSQVDGAVLRYRDLHVAYSIAEIAKETGTVRGRFVNDVLNSELDEAAKQRVIVTGLRALHGRRDLSAL